jgi:pimeloyl-ACP methyl ester carboxylesterase
MPWKENMVAMMNIVLVHGVWMDGSSWRKVIPLLTAAGHTVAAVQLPLTAFDDDVQAVERVLARQQSVAVLVGHSYGGAVISEAASGSSSVATLVYIAAFAPESREILGSIFARHPPATQVQPQPDQDGLVWATADDLEDAIAQDVDRPTIELLAATQKPYAAKIFGASIAQPAWKILPSWYLKTNEDRILNPETQAEMAARIEATVHEVPGSHLPLFSHPDAVAKIILEAGAAIE